MQKSTVKILQINNLLIYKVLNAKFLFQTCQ